MSALFRSVCIFYFVCRRHFIANISSLFVYGVLSHQTKQIDMLNVSADVSSAFGGTRPVHN